MMFKRPEDPRRVYIPMRAEFSNPVAQSIADSRPRLQYLPSVFTLRREVPSDDKASTHLQVPLLTERQARRSMRLCRIDEDYLGDVVFEQEAGARGIVQLVRGDV